jgi:hypothetical protein
MERRLSKDQQRITVRIPRPLVDALDAKAKGNERSLSAELRLLIRRHLEADSCRQ